MKKNQVLSPKDGSQAARIPFLRTRKAKFFFLVLLPSVFLLLFLEVLMIVLEPYAFKGFYQYDPDMGFRIRGHFNRPATNRHGFNDRDYPLEKPAGTYRILVLGDSFNWAGGLEGNYINLLKKEFEERPGDQRVEVLNVGYPMTHTGEQLALLKKYGILYHPDFVFLGFFLGNDFIDADPFRKRIVVNDTCFDVDRREIRTLFGRPLMYKSRLYYYIRQKIRVWQALRRARVEGPEIEPLPWETDKPTFSEEDFLEIERYRMEICDPRNRQFDYKIDYIKKTIQEMQEFLNDKDIGFAVGIYPDEYQVNEELRHRVIERFDLAEGQITPDRLQMILTEYLDSRAIPFVDLTELFKEENPKASLYKIRDGHWNAHGNQTAAQAILPFLQKVVQEEFKTDETAGSVSEK